MGKGERKSRVRCFAATHTTARRAAVCCLNFTHRCRVGGGAPRGTTMSKRKATDAGAADEEDNLLHTHCTHIGSRPAQEDRLTIVDDGWSVAPDSADWPRCRFYAVFDGHLGGAAAEAASFVLWSHLQPALIALQRRSPSGDDAIEGDAPSSEALALSADGGAALPSAAAGVAAPPLAAPPSAEALKAAMREAFRATEQQLLEQVDSKPEP